MTGLIAFLIIGLIAGWLAGQLWQGRGFGLGGNLLLGLSGALVGGFLFQVFGITPRGIPCGSLVTATLGAMIVLYLANLFRGKR